MFTIRGVLNISFPLPADTLKRKSQSFEESFSCLLLRELSSLQTQDCLDSVLFYQRKVHDGLTLEIQIKKIANKIPFRETGRKLPLSRKRFFILWSKHFFLSWFLKLMRQKNAMMNVINTGKMSLILVILGKV